MKVWFLGGPRHGQQHDVPGRHSDLPDLIPVLGVAEEVEAADPTETTSRMWEQVVYHLRWLNTGVQLDRVTSRRLPCYCTDDFDGPVPAEVWRA